MDIFGLTFLIVSIVIGKEFTKYRFVKKQIGDQEVTYYFEKKKEL